MRHQPQSRQIHLLTRLVILQIWNDRFYATKSLLNERDTITTCFTAHHKKKSYNQFARTQTTVMISTPRTVAHNRNKSQESIASDIWSDCYDELSLTDNSILDSPKKVPVEEPPRTRKVTIAVSTSPRKQSTRRGRKRRQGTGAVSKTILGPASVLMGGRQEWSKMKQYVRELAAAQGKPSVQVHNSELV